MWSDNKMKCIECNNIAAAICQKCNMCFENNCCQCTDVKLDITGCTEDTKIIPIIT